MGNQQSAPAPKKPRQTLREQAQEAVAILKRNQEQRAVLECNAAEAVDGDCEEAEVPEPFEVRDNHVLAHRGHMVFCRRCRMPFMARLGGVEDRGYKEWLVQYLDSGLKPFRPGLQMSLWKHTMEHDCLRSPFVRVMGRTIVWYDRQSNAESTAENGAESRSREVSTNGNLDKRKQDGELAVDDKLKKRVRFAGTEPTVKAEELDAPPADLEEGMERPAVGDSKESGICISRDESEDEDGVE